MKKKILQMGMIFGGMLLVFLIAMFVLFDKEERRLSRAVEYWASDIVPELEHLSLKDGVIEQSFVAQHDYLENIYLFFDYQTAQDTGTVFVTLEDRRGRELASWSAGANQLGEDTFCLLLYPYKELHANQEYTIRIALEDGESAIAVSAMTIDAITIDAQERGTFHRSVDELSQNGELREETALHFVQRYQIHYYYAVIGVVAFLICFLCCVYSAVFPDRSVYLRRAFACAVPFLAFAGVELLSGNLGLTAGTEVWKNILLIAMILLLGRCILGKYADYAVIFLAFLTGGVNHYVVLTRGTEFTLLDIRSFSTAMTVVGNYELTLTASVFIVAVVAILMIATGIYMDRKGPKGTSGKERILCGTLGGMAALVMFIFVLPGSGISLYDISGSLTQKGWCWGNACLLKVSSMKAPEGYSEQSIEAVLDKYDEEKEREQVVPENIIVIMNEALSDLQILGDLEVSEDSLSFIRSLSDNTIKGNLHMPTIGGNTCNSEYEFLTGNSMHFISPATIPFMVLCKDEEPGISSVLRSQGYYTVAMHPYNGQNWNRDDVYESMGFEEFLDIEEFRDAERIRGFVSDKGDYDRLVEYYEAFNRENEDEGLFIFNVTMQNHGGYDTNTGTIDRTVAIENLDSELAENYLSLIKESDEAFEYLVDYFSRVEEPTMIVMFGDHQPSLHDSFYEQLNAVSTSGKNTEGDNIRNKFVTPYLIWTNYESDFEEIPDMSANYLSSYVMQCAGLELSEYQEFLLQFMEKYPVIGIYGVIDAEGTYTPYDGNAETGEWLKEYEMLQYLRIKDRGSKYFSIFHTEE